MSPERTDQLLSLIVEGEATREQWEEFTRVAEADPVWWAHLARSQRDACDLSNVLNRMVAVADRVALPVPAEPMPGSVAGASGGGATAARREPPGAHHGRRGRWWHGLVPATPLGAAAWGGWAVAAVLALAAIPGLRRSTSPAPIRPSEIGPAIATAVPTSRDAWQQYLDLGRQEGHVLGEIPARILLDAQEVPGHGYELWYLRPVLETMHVPEMYRFNGFDESGEPVLIRYDAP
jgi:hypothetical protein